MSRSSAKMLHRQCRVRGQCVPGEAYFDKRHSLHCEEWRQTYPRNEDNLTQKRGRPNSKIADDIPKKGRQPYPKTEDDLTQKSIFCNFFFKNALNQPKNTSVCIIFWLKLTTFCNFWQKNDSFCTKNYQFWQKVTILFDKTHTKFVQK